ncbi:unnamed protein product [Cyberlindnera jadinii]|uniref:Uncharacterized protein n=1 Tax=Cyberlindnera jadinii (strain ATCC 18201 / CBS 1600 / BCRC 20928 / JCM 3617 / NBRC 0987 / NRRL Y-1542) TaxID=983966 RepID=A0A0H5C8L1_CYBJN|nr:unnamed protein product [Cyberlindnera jadinii]
MWKLIYFLKEVITDSHTSLHHLSHVDIESLISERLLKWNIKVSNVQWDTEVERPSEIALLISKMTMNKI